MVENQIILEPQPGPQTQFLECSADIAFFGGSAGGGKSHALLLQPLAHWSSKAFNGVCFRRENPQIIAPGGMWSKANDIYRPLGAIPSGKEWVHKKWVLKFSHMEAEDDRFNWDGAELDLVMFDELQHFEESQFVYMISRLRSLNGIKPYLRATCNPRPNSWLSRMLQWWWDPDTGLAIPERSGVIRWFVRDGDKIVWGDTEQELKNQYPDIFPKSFTFIRSQVYDNKILLKKNPEYISNLMALQRVDRERLLEGNWKIIDKAGTWFRRTDFEIVDAVPHDIIRRVRYWDLASTKDDERARDEDEGKEVSGPAFTAGVKIAQSKSGVFYIEHVTRFREDPPGVERNIKATASHDGTEVPIYIEGDPGQSSKFQILYFVKQLAGYTVHGNFVRDSKGTRAKPVSAQAQAGNIKLVRAPWTEAFINEAESFDPLDDKCKKDQIDATSGGFSMLTTSNVRQFKVWSVS